MNLYIFDDKNQVKSRCICGQRLGEPKEVNSYLILGLDIIDMPFETIKSKSF